MQDSVEEATMRCSRIDRNNTLAGVLACMAVAAPAWAQARLDVLHAFPGNPGLATSRLLQATNGVLYGTVNQAGPAAAGAVYVAWVLPGGGLATVPLHVFNGSDGRWPAAGVIQGRDGALYGTTLSGGAAGRGTVYRVTLQGQFSIVHVFNGADGAFPAAELFEAPDGTMYGTTVGGGSAGYGTIFKITSTGTLVTVHSFTGEDGTQPHARLMQASDGNFYGTTAHDLSSFGGTVFRMTPAGIVETVHRFRGVAEEGHRPIAGLVQGRDGALYGATTVGGSPFQGFLFRITTAGELTVLRPASVVHGDLVEATDGAFYGTAVRAGLSGIGEIFRLTPAGDYTVLHAFDGQDGSEPYAGLIQARDGHLYGQTRRGGIADHGVVYRVTTSGTFAALGSYRSFDGEAPYGGVVPGGDGSLYGTTTYGGATNKGIVYRLAPGGEPTVLHSFSGPDGAEPQVLIEGPSGGFYGITLSGGRDDAGTLFVISPTGLFATVHHFTPQQGRPQGALVRSRDGSLYGTTQRGIFQISPPAVFRMFAIGPSARFPTAVYRPRTLVEAADGNLYGTADDSNAFWFPAALFRVTPAGAVTILYEFSCPPPMGCQLGEQPYGPYEMVAASDGHLYGMGGTHSGGSILFRLSTTGELTPVRDLAADGCIPHGLVQAADGRLYGAGTSQSGYAVCAVTTAGASETIFDFGRDNGSSFSRLSEGEPGVFYGTAARFGPALYGYAYRLTVSPTP
jgi:uncharacterized repeat protein (TIGR03803 family)